MACDPMEIKKDIHNFFKKRDLGITELTPREASPWPTSIVGNDPEIPHQTLVTYQKKDKIALVATSGMRAISIACALGDPSQTPHIFLIDYSLNVCSFWRAMKKFIKDDSIARTSELFLQNLLPFIQKNKHLIWQDPRDIDPQNSPDSKPAEVVSPDGLGNPAQSSMDYFTQLIAVYGYEYVRAVIQHTTVICQSWADKTTFTKIKYALDCQGVNNIFTYPSNIIASTEKVDDQRQVAENISILSPVVSIHTDVCLPRYEPEHVYFIEDQNPDNVLDVVLQKSPTKENQLSISGLCA